MVHYKVTLTQEERNDLLELSRNGTRAAKTVMHALVLLSTDAGEHQTARKSNQEIADFLHINNKTIERIRKKFVEEGLDAALDIKPRLGKIGNAKKFDGDLEAHLIAMCCGPTPEGRSVWTLRLLAEKIVELQYADAISHETIRQILKKRNLNLGCMMNG